MQAAQAAVERICVGAKFDPAGARNHTRNQFYLQNVAVGVDPAPHRPEVRLGSLLPEITEPTVVELANGATSPSSR